MPVQINEVIIRAVVDPAPVSNGANPPPPNNNAAEFEAIEKVLEIIKEKQER